MTRTLPLVLLAGGALLSATAGFAATATPQAAPHKTATRVTTVKRTTTTSTAKPRMVTAKLANGKTVTYNCSLAGNASKQACK